MAKRVSISGETYPVRQQLKALGGKWDAATQSWNVPAKEETHARVIVAAAESWKAYKSALEIVSAAARNEHKYPGVTAKAEAKAAELFEIATAAQALVY